MTTMIDQETWYADVDDGLHLPALIAAAPHIGLRCADRPGLFVWTHYEDAESAYQSVETGAVFAVGTDPDTQRVPVLPPAADLRAAVAHVRQTLPGRRQPHDISPVPEMCDWLRHNPHPSACATNRFGGTRHALAFFERLYDVGVTAIRVADSQQEVSGWYTDTVLITLPSTRDQIQAIWQFLNTEVRTGGCMIEATDEQHVFWLCWD